MDTAELGNPSLVPFVYPTLTFLSSKHFLLQTSILFPPCIMQDASELVDPRDTALVWQMAHRSQVEHWRSKQTVGQAQRDKKIVSFRMRS